MVIDQSSDRGLTLVEVLISASLLLLTLVMFGGSLVTAQKAQGTSSAYSRANDQAQLALQTLDRQIRSGFVVGTVAVSNADAAVKIYSEAGGSARCFAWVVADSDVSGKTGLATLYLAEWDPKPATPNGPLVPMPSFAVGSAAWRPMATDLWNWLAPTQVEPFQVPPPASTVLKSLDVAFVLNASNRPEAAIELKSSFTSRNVERENEKDPTTATLKSGVC